MPHSTPTTHRYDHETEKDWKQMTAEEERILKLLPGYKKDFDV